MAKIDAFFKLMGDTGARTFIWFPEIRLCFGFGGSSSA